MTCDEAREAFSDLFDGTLSGAPLAALNQHLEGCSACRAEWAAFWKAMQAVADLATAEPSPGFAARVRQQLEEPPWGQRVVRFLFFPPRVKVPIQALALTLLAFAGLMVYQRSPELRRETESHVPSSGPVARPAPPPTPSPPVSEEKIQTEADAKPRADAMRPGRAERRLPPLDATAPAPKAGVEGEKDRALSLPREEAKALAKTVIPTEPGKTEEPSQESRAKGPEPSMASRKLQQAAPATAESRDVVGAPAQARPSAPLKEVQVSSIPRGSADELFSAAVTEFVRQGYDRAIEGFRAFIAQHPRDGRVPDARFYLADAYFAQQRYAEAIPEYEALVKQYPDSRRVPTALYRYGQARLALGDQGGCQVLRDATNRYPKAREAALAREVLSARCP